MNYFIVFLCFTYFPDTMSSWPSSNFDTDSTKLEEVHFLKNRNLTIKNTEVGKNNRQISNWNLTPQPFEDFLTKNPVNLTDLQFHRKENRKKKLKTTNSSVNSKGLKKRKTKNRAILGSKISKNKRRRKGHRRRKARNRKKNKILKRKLQNKTMPDYSNHHHLTTHASIRVEPVANNLSETFVPGVISLSSQKQTRMSISRFGKQDSNLNGINNATDHDMIKNDTLTDTELLTDIFKYNETQKNVNIFKSRGNENSSKADEEFDVEDDKQLSDVQNLVKTTTEYLNKNTLSSDFVKLYDDILRDDLGKNNDYKPSHTTPHLLSIKINKESRDTFSEPVTDEYFERNNKEIVDKLSERVTDEYIERITKANVDKFSEPVTGEYIERNNQEIIDKFSEPVTEEYIERNSQENVDKFSEPVTEEYIERNNQKNGDKFSEPVTEEYIGINSQENVDKFSEPVTEGYIERNTIQDTNFTIEKYDPPKDNSKNKSKITKTTFDLSPKDEISATFEETHLNVVPITNFNLRNELNMSQESVLKIVPVFNTSEKMYSKESTFNELPITENPDPFLRQLDFMEKELKRMEKKHKTNKNSETNSIMEYADCSQKNGGCDHLCILNEGVVHCACYRGFRLGTDRQTCHEINECHQKNGGCSHKCHNIPGTYYCSCPSGLRIGDDKYTCDDINECLLRNGHGPCQDTCTNTRGSYTCGCDQLTGTRLAPDGHTCEDLDECSDGRAGCSHSCLNTLGRAFCLCPLGLELGPDWKTCHDINECENKEVASACEFGCVNTEGSYRCIQPDEWQNDQIQNIDAPDHIVCPPLFPPEHGFIECRRDLMPSPGIRTSSGRYRITNRPGTACKLVCPEGYKKIGEYRQICGAEGKWFGWNTGKCIPFPRPTITCSNPVRLRIPRNRKLAIVKLIKPVTDVDFAKDVQSNPPAGKNLRLPLPVGRHWITFTATHPVSKLTSKCTIYVVITH